MKQVFGRENPNPCMKQVTGIYFTTKYEQILNIWIYRDIQVKRQISRKIDSRQIDQIDRDIDLCIYKHFVPV